MANLDGASLTDVAQRLEGLMGVMESEEPEKETQEVASDEEAEEVTEPEEADEVEADSEQSDDGETDEESEELYYLDQVAEKLGLDADSLLSLKTRVKVNGEEQEVTLGDLRSRHMMESDYRRKTAELADQRRAFETEQEGKAKQLQESLQQAQKLSEVMESQLLKEYNAVNWAELRQYDPGEFAAKHAEFNNRYNEIQRTKSQAVADLEAQQKTQAEKLAEMRKESHKKNLELISAEFADFADPVKRPVSVAKLTEYLKSEGFSESDIGDLSNEAPDVRLMRVFQKALKYDALEKQAKPEAKRKVENAPKMQKPGTHQSKGDLKAQRKSEIRKELKKKGDIKSAAKFFEQFS